MTRNTSLAAANSFVSITFCGAESIQSPDCLTCNSTYIALMLLQAFSRAETGVEKLNNRLGNTVRNPSWFLVSRLMSAVYLWPWSYSESRRDSVIESGNPALRLDLC